MNNCIDNIKLTFKNKRTACLLLFHVMLCITGHSKENNCILLNTVYQQNETINYRLLLRSQKAFIQPTEQLNY